VPAAASRVPLCPVAVVVARAAPTVAPPVSPAAVDVARTLVSVVDAVATVVAVVAVAAWLDGAPIRIVNPDALTSP
jgi:hypothetical protein